MVILRKRIKIETNKSENKNIEIRRLNEALAESQREIKTLNANIEMYKKGETHLNVCAKSKKKLV